MSDLPESELRSAFAARLEMLSPEREARLRAFDYRSRAGRHRGVRTAIGAGATALVGGVVVAIVMLSSGASVAEGWTAVPSAPSAAAVAAATAACNWVNDRNGPPVLRGTPVLTDGRGSYTAAIYVDGHTTHICISNGQHEATGIATNGRILSIEAAPGPGQLGLPSGGGGSAPGFPGSLGQEGDVYGLAGREVSAVTFEFADRGAVEATVQNGWYFAWWPGDSRPSSVRVTTSTGTSSSPMSGPACVPETTGCVFAGSKADRGSTGS